MQFTKMHGLGNDYLYVFDEVPENISELSIKLSDRHFGVSSLLELVVLLVRERQSHHGDHDRQADG